MPLGAIEVEPKLQLAINKAAGYGILTEIERMFLQRHSNNVTGFTLLELLVVIAIIGLLAAIVIVSLNDARTKAANSKTIQTVQEVEKALGLYYGDNGTVYMGSSCVGDDPTALAPLDPSQCLNFSFGPTVVSAESAFNIAHADYMNFEAVQADNRVFTIGPTNGIRGISYIPSSPDTALLYYGLAETLDCVLPNTTRLSANAGSDSICIKEIEF